MYRKIDEKSGMITIGHTREFKKRHKGYWKHQVHKNTRLLLINDHALHWTFPLALVIHMMKFPIKKFLSAEPTAVLSKFLILTFTRVNIG